MATETRKLTRSTSDRVIGGVAGGLGRYFNVDPVIMRLAFIALAVAGGAGFLIYLAAWLIVPTDDPNAPSPGAGYVLRRLGMALGVLALTMIGAIAGFVGFGNGGAKGTAIVIIAVGGALALGAFLGGVRWLILPAMAFALAAGTVAAADVNLRGGTGERIYHPETMAGLRTNYRLGLGHLRLDLRNLHLSPGDHTVNLKLGVGEAEVLVPPSVCVSTDAKVAAGATTVFDNKSGGSYHEFQETRQARPGAPHLTVNADVGLGLVRIEPSPTATGTQEGACING